jgi:protein Mpv17
VRRARKVVAEHGGWYTRALVEKPLLTNSLTAALLAAIGDAGAQAVEYALDIMSPGKSSYNWGRTINMAAFGLVSGPIYSLWYRGLDRAAKSSTFALSYEAQIGSKVMADAVLASPFMLHLYYGITGLLEGRSSDDIMENARGSFYKAWGLGLSVWMPVQVFNFHLTPVHLQPIVVAFVDTAWKLSLSLLNHYAAYGKKGEAIGAEKAAPALSFDWPTPTYKLQLAQVELAAQAATLAAQEERLAAQEAEIGALKQKIAALSR